ncbi:hypothetical protein ACIQXD_32505 [Streptomyces uncialis]|uniref:hypothetical protein n=1 Tax=Streptomyces uncialis TaxID=1048205 RepID=UPI0037FCA356
MSRPGYPHPTWTCPGDTGPGPAHGDGGRTAATGLAGLAGLAGLIGSTGLTARSDG